MARTPASFEDQIRHTIAGAKEMDQAILAVHWRWATLEDAMARLLDVSICETILDGELDSSGDGYLIYFAPSNTETRFKIVDTIVRSRLVEIDTAAIAHWATILNALNRLKSTRNRVIHGQVTTCSFVKGGKRVSELRLMASLWDTAKLQRGQGGGFDGLTAHDVQNCANAMGRIHQRISDLFPVLSVSRAGDTRASLKKWSELAARLKTAVPLQDGQTPPKDSSPPPPSRASPRKKRTPKG